MAKMWAGRTEGKTDRIADDFNASIHFDCRMYKQDITGSMAHAAMLAARGIIAEEETGLTSREGVYAGGDAVTGAATVILAMGAGKNAATAIDEKLMGNK